MKKELRIKCEDEQKRALLFLVDRMFPQYSNMSEFIKDSIAKRFNCGWGDIQRVAREMGLR